MKRLGSSLGEVGEELAEQSETQDEGEGEHDKRNASLANVPEQVSEQRREPVPHLPQRIRDLVTRRTIEGDQMEDGEKDT